MQRLWIVVGLLVGLLALSIGVGPVSGQAGGGACGVIVETALSMAGQLCGDLGRNEACYGHALLHAEPQPDVADFRFERLGDRTGLDTLGRLRLSALDETTGQWGVAILKAQAGLPDTLPGQNVTLVLFGNTELAPQSGGGTTGQPAAVIAVAGTVIVDQPSLAGGPVYGPLGADTPLIAEGHSADDLWLWVRLPEGGAGWVMAMATTGDASTLPVVDASGQPVGGAGSTSASAQAYYFASGMNDVPCAMAPASGLLIQSPADAGTVHLRLDGVDIALASTAYVQAAPGGELVLSLLEGQATVGAAGATQVVPAGWRIHVPLDAQGAASGPPSAPEAYDLAALNALPLILLERPIDIAAPGSGTASDLTGEDHAMGDGLREDQETTNGGTGDATGGGPNLIVNGDFEQGFAGWEMIQECEACGMQTNIDPDPRLSDYLAWQRTASGGAGGAIWARQPLHIDIRQCTDLHLGFDVRVDDQTLTNSGWYSDEHGGNGEYPVLVRLAFMPAFQGSQFDWAQGFLTIHDGTTTLRNYTVVPAGQWVRYEADVQSPTQWVDGFGMALTNPGVLTDIYVGGSGWDFTGAIDNLFLTGTNCPRNLP